MQTRAQRKRQASLEVISKKKLYKSKKNWVVAGSCLIAGAIAISTQTHTVSAATPDRVPVVATTNNAHWAPNSVASIKSRIADGQTSLTMISGDTVYNIGLAINLKHPMQLLYDNGFKDGEQYTLPIGTVICWDGNHVTVQDAEGKVIGDKVVKDSQKVDPSAPIANQTSDQQSTPVQTDQNGNVVKTPTNSTTSGSKSATDTAPVKNSIDSTSGVSKGNDSHGNPGATSTTPSTDQSDGSATLTPSIDTTDKDSAGVTGTTPGPDNTGKVPDHDNGGKDTDTNAGSTSQPDNGDATTEPEFAQGEIVAHFVTKDANGNESELSMTASSGDTGSTIDFADLVPEGYQAVGNTKFVVKGGKGQGATIVVQKKSTATTPITTPDDSGETITQPTPTVVNKTALNAAIAKAAALSAKDYTKASFANLINALASAKLVAKGATATQIAVDLQTTALQNAQNALVHLLVTNPTPVKVDKTALNAAVTKASAYTADKFTTASFDALNKALATAMDAQSDAKATQATVDQATTALNHAIASLQTKPTTTPLTKTRTITIVYQMGGGGDLGRETKTAKDGDTFTYTNNKTFDGYTLVSDKTQSFKVNGDATIVYYYNKAAANHDQQRVETARQALNKLYNEVAGISAYDTGENNWNIFQADLAHAQDLIIKSNSATELNHAAAQLKQAAKNLVDRSKLSAALTAAQQVTNQGYTDLSWHAFVAEKVAAQKVLDNEVATSTDLGTAVSQLEAAQANLLNLNAMTTKIRTELMAGINNYRVSKGKTAATAGDSILQKAADIRANDLFTYYEHTRPNGQDYLDLTIKLGYQQGVAFNENIMLYDQISSGSLKDLGQTGLEDWIASPAHNATLLSSSVKFASVGVSIKEVSAGVVKVGLALEVAEPW